MRAALLFGLSLLLVVAALAGDDSTEPVTEVSSCDGELAMKLGESTPQVVVYYLHGNRRCATCQKLEEYSQEAVTSGFDDQLKSGAVDWQVVNFESEGNEHFAKDYQLFSQSLILSRQVKGQETEWKSLDSIWLLVGDKEKYLGYVTHELQAFLSPADESAADEDATSEDE